MVRVNQVIALALVMLSTTSFSAIADDLKVVQIYKQSELIGWINKNQHLNKVVEDRCQLVEDIKARAEIVKIPAYEFLWGDMLAWGVCVEKNATLGLHYIEQSARQGLPAGLEQMGRYYANGILVQKDMKRALEYLREGSAGGNLNAQLQLVELFNQGYGSPLDYGDAYHWLHNAVIADDKTHKKASLALAKLAEKMPEKVVKRAMRPLEH